MDVTSSQKRNAESGMDVSLFADEQCRFSHGGIIESLFGNGGDWGSIFL